MPFYAQKNLAFFEKVQNTMNGDECFNEKSFFNLCLKEKSPYFEDDPPFNLLIDPKSFLASEMLGIYPEETNFVEALLSEDPKCTSIIMNFLSYERNFVKNMNVSIKILVSLIGNPIFKALPESILTYSRNVLEEHKLFLKVIENILTNHSKIFIIEFIETLVNMDPLLDSHKKYIFNFSNVENIADQLSIGDASPQIIAKIHQIIDQNIADNIYYKHDPSNNNKTDIQQPETTIQHQNSQTSQNTTNSLNQNPQNSKEESLNNSYSNNVLLINYFKLPIKWQNHSIDTTKSLLQTNTIKSLPDPQLIKTLTEFIKNNKNLNDFLASIPKLHQISKMFLKESFPIVVNGRRFLREGKALKQCRKCTSERVLLLFSDIFVYVQAKAGRYLVPRIYRLSYLRIESHMHPTSTSSLLSLFANLNSSNADKNRTSIFKSKQEKSIPTIYFFAPRKSFILIFSTVEERDSWFQCISEAIENSRSNMIVPKYSEAPLWMPDNVVTRCINCKTQFSLTQRKHHCRGCGQIMCKRCLVYQVIMRNISMHKPVKVCKNCYNRINEERIRKENFKKLHPGQKDEEEIMIANLNKLIPHMFESSSDTSEEDSNDMSLLLGAP